MNKKPILFIIFNRPDLTFRVFERIKEYKPEKLYIAADGPRLGKPSDVVLCKQTKFVLNKIDWPCKIKTLFRESNLGCKIAVSSAISWFFGQEEMGIILEDDTLPNHSFFIFCEDLLEKYKNNDKISMIAGSNYSLGKLKIKESYYFSKYSHIWGWASWRRAWKDYEVNMESFKKKGEDFFKNNSSFSKLESNFWFNTFCSVIDNGVDTWDYQWVWCNFYINRYSIMPKVNLISNIGFRNDATHTKSINDKYSNMISINLEFPLKYQNRIEINHSGDRYSRKQMFPIEYLYPSVIIRIINYINIAKKIYYLLKNPRIIIRKITGNIV